MWLLCGVNIPLDALPGWLAQIGRLMPLTHGIAAGREVAAGARLSSVSGSSGRRSGSALAWGDDRVHARALVRVRGPAAGVARDVLAAHACSALTTATPTAITTTPATPCAASRSLEEERRRRSRRARRTARRARRRPRSRAARRARRRRSRPPRRGPPPTTYGTALAGQPEPAARAASGIVTKTTPSRRGGRTAQAIGRSRLARPVAYRPAPNAPAAASAEERRARIVVARLVGTCSSGGRAARTTPAAIATSASAVPDAERLAGRDRDHRGHRALGRRDRRDHADLPDPKAGVDEQQAGDVARGRRPRASRATCASRPVRLALGERDRRDDDEAGQHHPRERRAASRSAGSRAPRSAS